MSLKNKPIYVGSAPNGCLQIVCHSKKQVESVHEIFIGKGNYPCLLYTSPSPRD